jgi:uncharacterized protein YjgD (DUF1641 family)
MSKAQASQQPQPEPAPMQVPPEPMQQVLTALGDALTDGMVERGATTASNTLEIVDRLNDPATREAVHTLLDGLTALHRNGGLAALLDVGHLLNAARNAVSDNMVERGVVATTSVLELADQMTQPETRDAIHTLLEELTTLHHNGGIITLFELIHFLNAMRNAATDNIVERGAMFVEQMVNNLANEEVAAVAGVAHSALHEAAKETAETTHRGGLFATLGMLSKPETQASLGFLLAFANKLRERA